MSFNKATLGSMKHRDSCGEIKVAKLLTSCSMETLETDMKNINKKKKQTSTRIKAINYIIPNFTDGLVFIVQTKSHCVEHVARNLV